MFDRGNDVLLDYSIMLTIGKYRNCEDLMLFFLVLSNLYGDCIVSVVLHCVGFSFMVSNVVLITMAIKEHQSSLMWLNLNLLYVFLWKRMMCYLTVTSRMPLYIKNDVISYSYSIYYIFMLWIILQIKYVIYQIGVTLTIFKLN